MIEINKIIENELIDFEPDTFLLIPIATLNKDHVKVYDSTIIAIRPGNGIKSVYTYEVLSSTEWRFSESFLPNTFFSLTKRNIEEKCKAFKLYDTESKPFPYPRNETGIKSTGNNERHAIW